VIIDYTFEDLQHLKRILMCLYDDRAFAIFKAEFERKLQQLKDE
jgi:hypothetical protein